MDIRSRDALKQAARQALGDAAYDPRRLALIHAGAAVLLSLVLTALNYFLTRQIDGTGGLSGMGTRTILSTVQSMLSVASAAVMPFWEIGFVYAAIRMARREEAGPESLLRGFRRFGPVLRLSLLQMALYIAIGLLVLQVGMAVFIMTPFSNPLMEAMQTLIDNAGSAEELVLDAAVMGSLSGQMLPLYIIVGILFAVIAVPIAYRFRLAQHVVVDDPRVGALKALGTSHRMMKYNRFAMFRLDLSFWWYYVLQLLAAGIAYADMLLPVLGIQLPISSDAAFFAVCILYSAAQLGIAWYAGSFVSTTYAKAYDALKPEGDYVSGFRNTIWDMLP